MGSYSFQDVTATLVGTSGTIDLGYGSSVAEEGITIAYANPRNKMRVGADGEGMNSLLANKSGTVTVRLLKTSPVNAKLSQLYNEQSLSSSAWGQNLITIEQKVAGDKTLCRSCAFQKHPDLTYATEADIIQWVFDVVKIDALLGTY